VDHAAETLHRQPPSKDFGSRSNEQERIRASLDTVTARNPNIKISAKVASNHGAILRKDFLAIAEAVREVAALDQGGR
jgi:hypothetical protein